MEKQFADIHVGRKLRQHAHRSFPYFAFFAVLLSALASLQGLMHAAEESDVTRVIMLTATGAFFGVAVSWLTHRQGVCDDAGTHPNGAAALFIALLAGGVHVFSDALVIHAAPTAVAMGSAIVAIGLHEIVRTSAVGGVLASLLKVSLSRGIVYSFGFTAATLIFGLVTGHWLDGIYPEHIVLPISIGYFISSLISLTWHRLGHEMHQTEEVRQQSPAHVH